MSKVAQKFRRTELTRAIKAAEAANAKVSRAEIAPDGRIVIVMGQSDAPRDDEANEWKGAAAT
jgi:hypothetical protein